MGTAFGGDSFMLRWDPVDLYVKRATADEVSEAGGVTKGATNSSVFVIDTDPVNLTGTKNVFVGRNIASQSTTATRNVIIGSEAGKEVLNSVDSIFIGESAGKENTTGFRNTFIGTDAGTATKNAGDNVFIGYKSGESATQSTSSVFIGSNAGAKNVTAPLLSTGTFIGHYSGYCNTTGAQNTFIGGHSGRGNIVGSQNTYIGQGAGSCNFTGSSNVFLGFNAGRYTTSGCNVFLGSRTGECSVGTQNTFIGPFVGISKTLTGSCNTFIGGCSGPTMSSGFNGSIAIGYKAEISSNNQLSIASDSVPLGTASTFTSGGPAALTIPVFWLNVTVNGIDGKLPIYGV